MLSARTVAVPWTSDSAATVRAVPHKSERRVVCVFTAFLFRWSVERARKQRAVRVRPGADVVGRAHHRHEHLVSDAARDLYTIPGSLCQPIVDVMLPHGATRDDAAMLIARAQPLSNPLLLSFPAEVEAIPTLRRVLGRWLHEADASTTEIDEISLACSEACANAIEHAYAPGPASLEVRAALSEQGDAVVCVRDFGSWRAPRGSHRGRGTILMRGLMDAVDIDPGSEGTTVRLVRRLGREAA